VAQVAVVTGAARNLGRTIALGLAAAGYHVVVNTRTSRGEAEQVVEQAERLGVRAVAVEADVSDEAAVAEMFRTAASLGVLRVLVNNAALRTLGTMHDLSLSDWRAVQSVVLDGSFLCIREALPLMLAGGGGHIVNILGGHAMSGDPGRVHVSAAKHGLAGLSVAVATAHAREGITANAVSPVGMRADSAATLEARRERVSDVVCFLASEAAGAVTGQVVEVDCSHVRRNPGGVG